jgi:hypothetical protein
VVRSDDSGRLKAGDSSIGDGLENVAGPSSAGGVGAAAGEPRETAYPMHDVVEPALARALILAAEAGRWELVGQIGRELAERRRLDPHRPALSGLFGAARAERALKLE